LPALIPTLKKIAEFDPRFDKRAKEQERLNNLELGVLGKNLPQEQLKLSQFEGQPFVTSMSDRTAAGGVLETINNVPLAGEGTVLRGGQDFMFENPGAVWASAQLPANQILRTAKEVRAATGQEPLFIPWRMAPTGGDFSTMTGETMMRFASSNMDASTKATLNADLSEIIEGFAGVDDPSSFAAFANSSGDARKRALDVMDKRYRDKGGLSIGEARLAVADQNQLTAQDGGIQNIGRIDSKERSNPSCRRPSHLRV